MHKLLSRQIRRCFGGEDRVPPEVRTFIEEVERAYVLADDDRAMREHSMDTVSEELAERYSRLQEVVDDNRRKAEELESAVSLLSATLESTADAIMVADTEGRMVRMNQNFVKLWCLSDEIVASRDDRRALDFVCGQLSDPEAFIAKVRDLYRAPERESIDELVFKDGRTVVRLSRPQRIGGVIVGRVWSFRDVTDQRRLGDQLRHSQKMEAVGSLAGGVAHDFNNLLTVILGHTQLLSESLRGDHVALGDLAQITEASERAAALTRQLLAFSRKQILKPEPLDVDAVIESLLPMVRRLIGVGIEISAERDARGHIIADRSQVEQAILNLVVNARDAVQSGGWIRIRTKSVVVENGGGKVAEDSPPDGEYICLSVADNGCGISPEIRERIFEPFFTTKEIGRGTGLGLSTVFGVVKQSGGYVTLESSPGNGTEFALCFPRAGDGIGTVAAAASNGERIRGNETILVAEDEAGVRLLVTRILEARGYHVLAAVDGVEACDLATQHAGSIALLITDVMMPRMGGIELAGQLRLERPDLPVIFISGYPAAIIDRGSVIVDEDTLIEKPFTSSDIAVAVRSSLDRAESRRKGV